MKPAKKTEKKGKPEQLPSKVVLPAGTTLLATPVDPTMDFKCIRCAHEWEWRKSRTKGKLPVRCPHCSSTSWNKAYVRKKTAADNPS